MQALTHYKLRASTPSSSRIKGVGGWKTNGNSALDGVFREGLDVVVSHTYHWALMWPRLASIVCLLLFLLLWPNTRWEQFKGKGLLCSSLREYNPSWWGSTAEFMGVESGAESSLGFAILLNTISRVYGSQMRPCNPFILTFESYICPLDTMHQRFQNPLTVVPAGDQLKHINLWGHFMSKPLQNFRLALSF